MKNMLMMAAVCLMAAMTFAAQCAATTKKGTQCKRNASPGSSYCWQHGGTTKTERAAGATAPVQTSRTTRSDDAVATATESRCQATTKKGTQCKRNASPGSKFCFQHAAMAADAESEKVTVPSRAGKETSEAATSGGQCAGTTKDGTQCKRKAKPGSKFCWQHDK